jgi:hypothetical protein
VHDLLAALAAWGVWEALRRRTPRQAGWPLLGVFLAAAVLHGQWGSGLVAGGLGTVLWGGRGHGARRRVDRWVLIRFWQAVALLTAAGFSVMAAVESAAPPGPLGADLKRLAAGILERDADAVDRFVTAHPWPEARQVAASLQHSWTAGLDPSAAQEMASAMMDQLAQEDRVAVQRAPLWTAALPGVALLNVLIAFLIPLGATLWHSWLQL